MSDNSQVPVGGQAPGPAPVAAASQQQQQLPRLAGASVPLQMLHPNQAGNEQGAGVLYDLSSFDPLQAHAFQLTASAGLANLLAPAPGGLQAAPADASRQPQQQHSVFNLHSAGLPPPIPANSQQPQYYLQPSTAQTGLQPIAPANPPGAGGLPPGFILPSAAPGTAPGYPQRIFPGPIPGVAPTASHLILAQQLQGAVAGASRNIEPVAPVMPSASKREGEALKPSNQPAAKKPRDLAPSVISSSTNTASKNNFNSQLDSKPPQEATQAELDKMSPAERRRYERNLREQQRSYKISQQIKELRDVLAESNVPFKPNKYSILLSVVDYIKQLQSRAIMLDAEHQKLITTIQQTNEMVSSGTVPSSADDDTNNVSGGSVNDSENEMLFVQGLDYRSIFTQCPAAIGIASLDGRIIECNPEFQELIGFQKADLLKQSLFNLVKNHQDIFRAMAEMLKVAEVPGEAASFALKNRFWSGEVVSNGNIKVSLDAAVEKDVFSKTYHSQCSLVLSWT